MTIPFPLSACLMMMFLFCWSSFRVSRSSLVRLSRFPLRSCSSDSSCLVFSMYSSSWSLARGGSHVDFFLKGCGSLSGLFRKKYCVLSVFAYCSKSLFSSSSVGGLGVGAKLSPFERTEAAVSESV